MKKNKLISSENDQFTRSFSEFFNISIRNSKTGKVNQQSVLNLQLFYHFPKILKWTIPFNSRGARDSKIGKKWLESSRILDYIIS